MRIQRRQFLKYCVGSLAALGLPMTVLGKLEQALADEAVALPKVIWLNGANCTGCTVSLANLFSDSGPTDIADLLINTIDLAFHPNLMGAAGDLAVQQLKDTAQGSYILVVEGGIPTAFNGHTCLLWTENGKDVTAMEAVQMLAPNAAAVLSVGTCSSYGGIPAGDPNPTGIVSVSQMTGIQTINIPGCPTHPDWIVWTIAHLLTGEVPSMDDRSRPRALYDTEIHKNCPRKGQGEAKTFGIPNQCLKEIGCKGPRTKSDCPSRKWNNGTNWCIGAGALCIGCTEQGFPDKFSPFYKLEYDYKDFEKPPTENPTLKFTRSEWIAAETALVAEGEGPAGQIVTLYNVDTGNQIGAVSVSQAGIWKFKQENPSPIPTRVQAVSGNLTVISEVANLPIPNTDAFTLKRAVWRADKQKLRIIGFGESGAVVEVFNNATSAQLGTAIVGATGRWKLILKNPATVACSVKVICNGKTITKAVKKAPGNCV